jgi:dimethylhistidine N-methyltransferase
VNTFSKDTVIGLMQKPKQLSSKYFYDEKGDQLFQAIMKMEEYYLTNSEYEILSLQKDQILHHILNCDKPFQLIEFGAGDGFKTKLLLEFLITIKADFEYIPIDISRNVLDKLQADLKAKWPELVCKPKSNTYFEALKNLSSDKVKLVLFLGSNIGNFNLKEARAFISKVNENLNSGDFFLIGVDLKKDPEMILNAYNDKGGITKAFNLNLLDRINKELGGDFRTENFSHFPTYDPVSGETRSFLISKTKQTVELKKLNEIIEFDYAEPIFMETSKKYDIDELNVLASKTNFEIIEHFYDCKHYFVDTLWRKK